MAKIVSKRQTLIPANFNEFTVHSLDCHRCDKIYIYINKQFILYSVNYTFTVF